MIDHESRIMTPGASLMFFGAGLLLQLLGFPLLLTLSVFWQDQPLLQMIAFTLLLIWFFLPVAGLFGMIVGVKCYLRNVGTFLPFLGIVMNALWLAAGGVICFYLFVIKISV
jgi:hypothetical protein